MLAIHAMFKTEEDAERAKKALREADFEKDAINVAVGREGMEEESVETGEEETMLTVYADDSMRSVAKTILNKANATRITSEEVDRPEGVPLYGVVPPQGFPKS